jgi:hypothetical protein
VTINFVKGTDGKVSHLVFTQGGAETQAKKVQ